MKTLKTLLNSLFMFIFSLGFIVILVLNLTPIYSIFIKYFKLEAATGLTSSQLKQEFRTLINYLQWPFIHKLKFSYFKMSEHGEIHFADVKNIFLFIYVFLLVILITTILFMLKSKEKYLKEIFISFNYFFYITIMFTLSLMSSMFFDFTKLFYAFHKLIFSNDYWLFEPSLDPIILALPEELFMGYGLLIVSLLLIEAIILKIIYIKRKSTH